MTRTKQNGHEHAVAEQVVQAIAAEPPALVIIRVPPQYAELIHQALQAAARQPDGEVVIAVGQTMTIVKAALREYQERQPVEATPQA